MGVPLSVTGNYTGTGAAKNISIGFVPDEVIIFNCTDHDSLFYWNAGIANAGVAGCVEGVSVIDTGAGATDVDDMAAGAGITTYAGTAGPSGYTEGFTVSGVCSENAKVFGYIARRNS